MNPPVYPLAVEAFASSGVDCEAALALLAGTPVSLHCWQGDDVGGFERPGATLGGGGIQVTGNHPGKARNLEELRADLDMALRLIPGRHRVNLHAIYGDFGGRKVERNEINPVHFKGWIEWAKARGLGLDFNPTFFSHPLADGGFTLSHRDAKVRMFWIEHAAACRRIAAAMGRALGTPAVTNLWIPDGCKDMPVDRKGPRERLEESLDAAFSEPIGEEAQVDAVESKLFGIGSESYVVGSHEFYLGYAVKRQKLLCLDMGHFHPTESVADKISSILQFVPAPAPAREPRGPMGQRPRRAFRRPHEGRHGGGRARRLPRPHPRGPRLLRREHQPHRRVGHRRAQRAEVPPRGPA